MNSDGVHLQNYLNKQALPTQVVPPSDLAAFANILGPGSSPGSPQNEHSVDAFEEAAEKALRSLVDWSDTETGANALLESVRQDMLQWVASSQQGPGATVAPLSSSSPLAKLVSASTELIGLMKQELSRNAFQLLSLNPSRRDQLLQLLRRLASSSHGTGSVPPSDTATSDDLRQWVEGPRSAAQETAFQLYIGQIATLCLAQSVLLKTWSDRGIRPWSRKDLSQINWTLASILRSKLPSSRDGWHVTKPNLFSWYSPSKTIQDMLFEKLDALSMIKEGPSVMLTLLKKQQRGFDHRFFQCLWQRTNQLGFQKIARHKYLFTPTLRDGSLLQAMPDTLVHPQTTWLALEDNLYELLVAELGLLWWGPTAPPLWAQGTGLEVHRKEQLTLNWSSPKPTVLQTVSEIESCVLAFVLEENVLRLNQRRAEAHHFRTTVDQLPFFKQLKGTETSLGALQASVALSKLRPGGILWWARSERLGPREGTEVIKSLFGKALLVAEWDWTGVEHTLPTTTTLFPPYLYLFMRESDFAKRDAHEPARVRVEGQLRSHVEVALLLEDGLRSWTESLDATKSRGPWRTQVFPTAGPQSQWLEHWPDSTPLETVKTLDQMRDRGTPLGQVATVRVSGDKDGHLFSPFDHHLVGISAGESPHGGSGLCVRTSNESQPSDFLVAVKEAHWLPVIATYLASPWVHNWLRFHGEHKKDKLILREQALKFIPISKRVLEVLQSFRSAQSVDVAMLLTDPVRWPKLSDRFQESTAPQIFVELAQALWHFEREVAKMAPMIHPVSHARHGQIRWTKILDLLPEKEKVPFTQHPDIRLTGVLPPHVPMNRLERVKLPSQGVLFATESGLSAHAWCQQSTLIDMLMEQAKEQTGGECMTWAELVDAVRLPRKLDHALLTAQEILRSHQHALERRDFLQKMAFECRLF